MKLTFKSFTTLVTIFFGTILATTLPAQAGRLNGVYPMVVEVAPDGSYKYCLDVDASKIGTVQGAEALKVLPCRNI